MLYLSLSAWTVKAGTATASETSFGGPLVPFAIRFRPLFTFNSPVLCTEANAEMRKREQERE